MRVNLSGETESARLGKVSYFKVFLAIKAFKVKID